MPLKALRRCEPLLDHLLGSLKPRRIIVETGRGDRASYYRNFKGYRIEKFGRGKMVQIARKELYERENEFWAQLLIVLWNEANKEIYNAFKEHVQTIDEDVEKVERIDDEVAGKWLDELLAKHTLEDLLVCVYMNEVRFTDAFVRQRMEAPLGIERPADDLFGADAYAAEKASEPAGEAGAAPEDAAAAEPEPCPEEPCPEEPCPAEAGPGEPGPTPGA